VKKPGPIVLRWLREQCWLHEAWAKSGPGCNGFWGKNPTQQRKDLEAIRDWLREMVKGME
jgi:hypothetical protein